MTLRIFISLMMGTLLFSCQEKKESLLVSEEAERSKWNIDSLTHRAHQHLDSTQWDLKLFKQDIETYDQYQEVFQNYPLNKSPFPVATYDYAVSYIPFTIDIQGKIIKGVRIGECEDLDCKKIKCQLTLLVLTNDKESEEFTLVDSRNFPYLTAQGTFKVTNNEFDWVFSASPDGFSHLLLNMKLFDLRFGELIIIYPQLDKSFLYEQIKDSPNNYADFEEFKAALINNQRVTTALNSKNNIQE